MTLAGPTVVCYSPDDVSPSPSPIADCSAYRHRGVSSVARARDRSITDKLRFTYVRYAYAYAARTDADVDARRCGLFVRARAHIHTRTVNLSRGHCGETRAQARASERNVTRGGSGQGYYHCTALADCDVSLHPDDNRSGTERSGFAHCGNRARRGDPRGLSSTPPPTIPAYTRYRAPPLTAHVRRSLPPPLRGMTV